MSQNTWKVKCKQRRNKGGWNKIELHRSGGYKLRLETTYWSQWDERDRKKVQMQKGMFLHTGLNSLVKPKKRRKQKYTLKKVIGRIIWKIWIKKAIIWNRIYQKIKRSNIVFLKVWMTRSLKRKSQVYLYLLENVHIKNSLDPNLPCKQVLAANICIMLSLCKTFHWQLSMSYNTGSLGGGQRLDWRKYLCITKLTVLPIAV